MFNIKKIVYTLGCSDCMNVCALKDSRATSKMLGNGNETCITGALTYPFSTVCDAASDEASICCLLIISLCKSMTQINVNKKGIRKGLVVSKEYHLALTKIFSYSLNVSSKADFASFILVPFFMSCTLELIASLNFSWKNL